VLLVTLESVTFRIESEVIRRLYGILGLHPQSLPFLSGDGFRALARWSFDATKPQAFSPHNVRSGDLVYCRGDWLRAFLEGPAQQISVPFSILSHNDDTVLTPEWEALLPPNLVRLFAQNADWEHPRVLGLPIGLENASKHYNGVVGDFLCLRRQSAPKKNRILFAFTEGTNFAVRKPANQTLSTNPLADRLGRMNSRTYRKIAARYRFIASPPGNGIDCHRTWESLYLRSIPIVIRSTLMQKFADLGLPLWLVDTYDELSGLTDRDLESRYEQLSPGLSSPALWHDYWATRVASETDLSC